VLKRAPWASPACAGRLRARKGAQEFENKGVGTIEGDTWEGSGGRGGHGYTKVRRYAGLQRLDGTDHNPGYHMDTVTATERRDRIGACPIAAIIERMLLDGVKTQA
jgi:hypothetical protein